MNYSPETGKALTLADVVNDEAAFTEAVNEKLSAKGIDHAVAVSDWSESMDLDAPEFTVDHDGISVFIRNEEGGASVFLPFGELKGIIKEELLPETEDFTVEFPYEAETSVILKDGTESELRITGTFVEIDDVGEPYIDQASTDISLDGGISRFFGFYTETPDISRYYFVRSGGRDYIYIIGGTFIDICLFAIEIDSGRLYYLGGTFTVPNNDKTPDLGPAGIAGKVYYEITDPHSFSIYYWPNGIGTATAVCETAAMGDGLPVRIGEVYSIDGMEYTLLRDINGSLLDGSGEIVGTVTLHAGDTVKYYRTDGSSWGDVLTSDGRTVRFFFTVIEDWPPVFIDGIPVPDIFEGADFIDY